MVHGYHVIWGTYGFWLPNDPRGSWSDFVASWELLKFGQSTKSLERAEVDLERWASWRAEAATALRYQPVRLNGLQASAVGTGFANAVRKSGFTIWACSILPDHVHLVIGRHKYRIEQIANLLKGEATKGIKKARIHPQARYTNVSGGLPSMWATNCWKVYLDSEAAIDDAIRYVEENPLKENKPRQNWSFVTPFTGLEKAWTVYHQ